MSGPLKIWIDFLDANKRFLAYDEPPKTDVDDCRDGYTLTASIPAMIAAAKMEERKRCAKIAAAYEPQHEANATIARQVANNIAAAIRGEKP